MATEYSSFLAARVINDSKLITYRLLSRELKIHVSKAKEYLAAFHESENRKKKGSCHATYIVTGTPKPLPLAEPKTDQDHDTVMESSPPMDMTQQDVEAIKTSSVVLVAEEDLEEIKESMQEVISIHIYSIEPGPLSDMLLVADASTELYARFPSTDYKEKSKFYGTTSNKYIKKREGAPPPPPPPQSTKSSTYVVPVKKEPVAQPAAAPAQPTAPKEPKKSVGKDFFGSMKPKKEEAAKPSQASEAPATSSTSKGKPPLKRGQSDLMSSFSNAQPKKKKEETPPPDFMDVDDEPEEEEPEDPEAKAAEAAKQETLRKKRQEEEEELRRMMDDDDEELENAPAEPSAASPTEETPEIKAESPAKEESESQPGSTAGSRPGRRKARRQITKKVRSKDENGYIVTREVIEWEEYSEDDVPAPAKPAAKPATKPNAFSAMKQASGSQKGKKDAGDGGGKKRDIASFFAKK